MMSNAPELRLVQGCVGDDTASQDESPSKAMSVGGKLFSGELDFLVQSCVNASDVANFSDQEIKMLTVRVLMARLGNVIDNVTGVYGENDRRVAESDLARYIRKTHPLTTFQDDSGRCVMLDDDGTLTSFVPVQV
jgi:hypothetical protein